MSRLIFIERGFFLRSNLSGKSDCQVYFPYFQVCIFRGDRGFVVLKNNVCIIRRLWSETDALGTGDGVYDFVFRRLGMLNIGSGLMTTIDRIGWRELYCFHIVEIMCKDTT